MRRQTVPVLLVLVMLAVALQACSSAPKAPPTQAPAAAQVEPAKAEVAQPTAAAAKPAATDKKFNVAYIVKMGDNPWFVTEAAGLKQVAKEKGVNLTIQDVKLDADAGDGCRGSGDRHGHRRHHHRRPRPEDRPGRAQEGRRSQHPGGHDRRLHLR